MTFNWKEPHHGYVGVIMVIIGVVLRYGFDYPSTGSGFIAVGSVIIMEEIWQIVMDKQYGGPIHWAFVNSIYKIPWFKKITDRLSANGKKK